MASLNVVSRTEVRVADDPLVVVRRGQGRRSSVVTWRPPITMGTDTGSWVSMRSYSASWASRSRAARAVGQDRFVLRVGDLEECVGHGESFWVQR